MRRPILLEVYKSGPWFKVSLLSLVYGAKLRERFPPGLRDTGPCKDSCKRTDASMEEEDGGQSHVQNYVGNCLHQGKHSDAPEVESEASMDQFPPLTHLTTCARQDPRVLCSGVKSSPTIVYGTAPTPIPYAIVVTIKEATRPAWATI